MRPFDCGDTDLNGFLSDDAKAFYQKRIGKTFLILDNDSIVAYFCLLNDKITRFPTHTFVFSLSMLNLVPFRSMRRTTSDFSMQKTRTSILGLCILTC